MSLVDVALLFGRLGLLSFGGGLLTLAEMQRELILRGVMNEHDFATAFALAQATPGPGILYLIPLGFRAAGVAGAIVALAAFVVPPMILVGVVGRQWDRLSRYPWVAAVNTALAPICVGLIAAGLYTVAMPLRAEPLSLGLAVLAGTLMARFGLNPTIIVLVGGALGYIGAL